MKLKLTWKQLQTAVLMASVGLGALYFMGSSISVPDSVANRMSSVLHGLDLETLLETEAELARRLEHGADYSDWLWLKSEVGEPCNYHSTQSTLLIEAVWMGAFSMFPPYAYTLIEADSISFAMNCDIAKHTNFGK
ncbi:hypothetical protein [Vibrio agarivorans]|uniref:Uncharacterized protein n=1 Tax=Vibrio agarivorans TaxID=153622 RepID=A0ABT7Y7H7_9VIBR|nr:hypothetical protein [Vibrio agarivorans]MDN2483998.1 hypothetical protein [Vibrio agarivorans]